MNRGNKQPKHSSISALRVLPRVETIDFHNPSGIQLEADAYRLLLGLASGLLEGLCGKRSLQQLVPWLGDQAIRQLSAIQPRHDWEATQLVSIRICPSAPNTIESVLRLQTPDRSFACTIRLERGIRKWRCTHFAFLTPNGLIE